jgi:hypothetical protein
LKKRSSSARWPGDVNDVAEPVQYLASIGARCLSRSAVCQVAVEMQAGDTRIPRRRIAGGKRIRKDVIDRALGRETVAAIPEVVNTAVDPDGGRHDRRESTVPIFDGVSCVKHDSSSRGLPVCVTLSQDSTTQLRSPVEVHDQLNRTGIIGERLV